MYLLFSPKFLVSLLLLLGTGGLIVVMWIGAPDYRTKNSTTERSRNPPRSTTTAAETEPASENPSATEPFPTEVPLSNAAVAAEDDNHTTTVPVATIASAALSADSNSTADSQTTSAAAKASELQAQIRQCAVQIVHRSGGGVGTGVIVGVGAKHFDVLTACHVVQGRNDLTVVVFVAEGAAANAQANPQLVRQEWRNVSVVACDEASDVARLRVDSPTPPTQWLPLIDGAGASTSGTTGTAAGQPSFVAWGISWGADGLPAIKDLQVEGRRAAKRSPSQRAVGYWVVRQASLPGESGGAMVDARGQVIGIASGNSQGQAYYVDLAELRGNR